MIPLRNPIKSGHQGLDPKLRAISFDRRQMLLELWVIGQELQDLIKRNNADHRDAEVTLDLLDRRKLAIATLLTIERNQDRKSVV